MSVRKPNLISLLLAGVLFSLSVNADDIRTERLQFEAGTTGSTIEASITGYDAVDYVVGARAGQTIAVKLKTDNTANYFNVIPPDEEDAAVFIGSISGGEFTGPLELSGDWKIRVYLMRSAARRNEVANFTLSVSVTGDADR